MRAVAGLSVYTVRGIYINMIDNELSNTGAPYPRNEARGRPQPSQGGWWAVRTRSGRPQAQAPAGRVYEPRLTNSRRSRGFCDVRRDVCWRGGRVGSGRALGGGLPAARNFWRYLVSITAFWP